MPQDDHTHDVGSDVEDQRSLDVDLTDGKNVIPASAPTTVDTPSNTPTDDL